jgi:hypothetical protein
MTKLENLDETCQKAADRTCTMQLNITLWDQQNHKIKTFSMEDIVVWFPKGKKNH